MFTPLITVALFYILGIALASILKAPIFLLVLFLLCSLALTIFSFRFHRFLLNFFLILDVVFTGASLYSLNFSPVSISHVRNFVLPWEVELAGTVVQEPEFKKGRISFLLESECIRSSLSFDTSLQPVRGLVKVTGYTGRRFKVPDYGQRILVRGKLKDPPLPSVPGTFNYRDYLRNKKIFAVFQADELQILGKGRINFFSGIAVKCRQSIRNTIQRTLPGDEGRLLRGVMLGEKGCIPAYLKDMFISTGLAHTLVVSGLHVGLVASIVFFFFFRILRLPRKIVSVITIPFVVLYCFITGANPPAVRALVLSIVVLMGYVLEREPDMLNNLALAALIILIFNPLSLFDASFQLSFLATLGIVYLVPFFQKNFAKILPEWFASPLAVSVSAQIGVAPLIAYYFNKVSVIALLANLFVVPILGIILSIGLAASVAGLFSIPVARFISLLNFVFLRYFISAIKFFSAFRFAFLNVPRPSHIFIAGYYTGMFAPAFKYGKWIFMGLWAILALYVWLLVFAGG